MYRKIVWCYVIILTLLDISLNSKLSAQGKSHGATDSSVPESMVEGVTFQEWGKESGGVGTEGAGTVGAVRMRPTSLRLGPRALGAPHSATVTIVNTANTTLHLASVAGTTPDFHASFFDSKTLAPDGNTTFSVVYLGRQQGPVSTNLFLHTSLGVYRYHVSAVGVASEWGVWPLLGLRVPANVTLQPLLTVRNPLDVPVQVTEVYSSGGWVRLSLPAGAAVAPRAAWLLPPRSERAVVRLAIRPPDPHLSSTAYVRIKTNVTELLVAVEARGVPAGEFVDPVQLRLRMRGHRDPPDTFGVQMGSSSNAGGRLDAAVYAPRCTHAPPVPPAAPAHTDDTAHHQLHNGNGAKSEGVQLSMVRTQIEPYQELTKVAELTFDYEKLWASRTETDPDPEPDATEEESVPDRSTAYCSGAVTLGRAQLSYSLRLLQGTLSAIPPQIEFVTNDGEPNEETEGEKQTETKEITLKLHNEFSMGIRVWSVAVDAVAGAALAVQLLPPRALRPGDSLHAATFRMLPQRPHHNLDTFVHIRTNITDYKIPLRVYSGKFILEWEWPSSTAAGVGGLWVGAVGTSSTRHIACRVRNPAPRPLCVTHAGVTLPGASFTLAACDHLGTVPPDHACRCIPGGGWAPARLTLVAPAREGPVRGEVRVTSPHAAAVSAVALTAHPGRLHAMPVHLDAAAPYSWTEAPLVVESSMALRMRVLGATTPADRPDAALVFRASGEDIVSGRHVVGSVLYGAERRCRPHCPTGLDVTTAEGAAWVSMLGGVAADMALLRTRRASFQSETRNFTLLLRTDGVVQLAVGGAVRLRWPRLLAHAATATPGSAGLAAVGTAVTWRLRVRNPSRSHPILLHAVLGPPPESTVTDLWENAENPLCKESGGCVTSVESFSVGEWQAVAGGVRTWAPTPAMLLLDPDAQIDLLLSFAPNQPSALTAYLYLRNNLTIVEGVQLAGRGAYPRFELGGRRPDASSPLLFEVADCGPGGVVRRALPLRNTGAVPVALRDWAVAGRACAARGFALSPCAPLTLAPNHSVPLTFTFTPDYTLARVHAALELRTERERLAFRLAAVTPPRVLRRCAALAPRPPWDSALRTAGTTLAVVLLALVVAAAALDAERLLRRARAARSLSPPRAPLDLRAVAAAPAPARPAPPAPRPAPRRRRPRKTDPLAESRAFERWRASLRRSDDTDSRSSEDAERDDAPQRPPPDDAARPAHAPPDADVADREDSSPPHESDDPPEEERARTTSGEEDAHSSGSDSSSSPLEPDDEPRQPRPAPPPPAPADPPRPAPPADPADDVPRSTRRRDAEARRAERRPDEQPRAPRPPGAKHHTRKDKPGKRRERTTPPTPVRVSPGGSETRGGAGAAGVRWGASWSSVVARSAAGPGAAPPLAPIGSDVRRRAPAPPAPEPEPAPQRSTPADNSLFYFNGEQPVTRPEPEYAWPPQPADRPFGTPTRDFIEEPTTQTSCTVNNVGAVGTVGPVGTGAGYGTLGRVWGGALEARAPGAAWPWPATTTYSSAPGGSAVRPPPGFGSAVGAVGSGAPARGPRPFDPFQSLAAIWSRTALDWRSDAAEDRE